MPRVMVPLLTAAALAVALGLTGPGGAAAGEDAHLAYRRSYADALLEARVRGVPVMVSRHKDG